MTFLRDTWITSLAVLNAAFLVFITIAMGVDDSSTLSERLSYLGVMGLVTVAFIGGLWGLRSGRLPGPAANAGIVIGLVGTAVWFWMIIPPIIAGLLLWFGVIKGGLDPGLGTGSVGKRV